MPDGDLPSAGSSTHASSSKTWVGWQTDYPFSERNLMRASPSSPRRPISRDSQKEPNTWSFARPILSCQLPIHRRVDGGHDRVEALRSAGLRDYLLKGGFLWVDDFGEPRHGINGPVRSAACCLHLSFRSKDVPLDDPLLRTLYPVTAIPQITNIQFLAQLPGAL